MSRCSWQFIEVDPRFPSDWRLLHEGVSQVMLSGDRDPPESTAQEMMGVMFPFFSSVCSLDSIYE